MRLLFTCWVCIFSLPYSLSQTPKMNQARVIIVGGGASGVAAATRLVQNGFQNVTVLEAEHRLGGRCNTVALGDDQIDLGAQWIHGRIGNVVYQMAAPLNMTKETLDEGSNFTDSQFFLPDKKVMNPATSRALYTYCLETTDRLSEEPLPSNLSVPVGEVFMKRFNESRKTLKDLNISDQEIGQFLEWYEKSANSLDALDSWYDMSLEGELNYERCGGKDVAWKTGGYSNVIALLLQKIPANKPEIHLNVQFGKEVTQITRDDEIVMKCADGSVYTADHVIIAVSLGVLKANIQTMFTPPLPANKSLAISTLALGVAEKLFLQFPHPWWPNNGLVLGILLDSEMKEELRRVGKEWLIEVFAFFALDNAPNTLCGWVGGNSARYISKLPDEVVMNDLFYYVQRFFSDAYTIPAPVKFARSNWFGNPHFKGAYSFITVQAAATGLSNKDLAEPVLDSSDKPLLMFAGEATHSHFFGTVHGAVATGWREADRLISYYNKSVKSNTLGEVVADSRVTI